MMLLLTVGRRWNVEFVHRKEPILQVCYGPLQSRMNHPVDGQLQGIVAVETGRLL